MINVVFSHNLWSKRFNLKYIFLYCLKYFYVWQHKGQSGWIIIEPISDADHISPTNQRAGRPVWPNMDSQTNRKPVFDTDDR